MEQVSFKKQVLMRGKIGDYLIYNSKGRKVDFTDNPANASHFDNYNQAEEVRQGIEKVYPDVYILTSLPIKINYQVGV